MENEVPLHPDLHRLRQSIQGLRTDPPQQNKGLKERLEKLLGQFPRFPGYFLYVYNYSEGRMVYTHGIQEILGYPDHEMDLDLLFQTVHPDDALIMGQLNQCALDAMNKIRNPANLYDLCLSVDYRIRKADGQYIKVYDQTSVFEVDEATGKVHSTFSLCKDISAIKSTNTIGWQAHGFEFLEFEPPEDSANRVQYQPTSRELDVLRKIAQGQGSKGIAEDLCISPMTVTTHRRNLLRRTGVRNTAELIRHASAAGWV